MNEFKDQREAYNTGMHDALNLTKHFINEWKLTTVDQVYTAMAKVLENHEHRQLSKQLTDAVRTKDYTGWTPENDESSIDQVVENLGEKKVEDQGALSNRSEDQATVSISQCSPNVYQEEFQDAGL